VADVLALLTIMVPGPIALSAVGELKLWKWIWRAPVGDCRHPNYVGDMA